MKYLFFIFLSFFVMMLLVIRTHESAFEKRQGVKFDIMDFELPKGKSNLNDLLTEWREKERKEFVLDQLSYDYIFMSTLFPAILCLCLWASSNLGLAANILQKRNKYRIFIKLLKLLAGLQIVAWLFDFCENARLEMWINQGYAGNMVLFESMVRIKFIFGICGFLLGSSGLIFSYFELKKQKKTVISHL